MYRQAFTQNNISAPQPIPQLSSTGELYFLPASILVCFNIVIISDLEAKRDLEIADMRTTIADQSETILSMRATISDQSETIITLQAKVDSLTPTTKHGKFRVVIDYNNKFIILFIPIRDRNI